MLGLQRGSVCRGGGGSVWVVGGVVSSYMVLGRSGRMRRTGVCVRECEDV